MYKEMLIESGIGRDRTITRRIGAALPGGDFHPIELIDAILAMDKRLEAIEAAMKPRCRVRPEFCLDPEEYAEQPRSDCEGV